MRACVCVCVYVNYYYITHFFRKSVRRYDYEFCDVHVRSAIDIHAQTHMNKPFQKRSYVLKLRWKLCAKILHNNNFKYLFVWISHNTFCIWDEKIEHRICSNIVSFAQHSRLFQNQYIYRLVRSRMSYRWNSLSQRRV